MSAPGPGGSPIEEERLGYQRAKECHWYEENCSVSDINRPQQSCDQGYVFTRVCDSVHGAGVSAPGPGGSPRQTPPGQTPPWADTPQADTPGYGQ